VVDDTVYVGSNDRTLYALDATSGDQKWSFSALDGIRSTPAVVDGTVYVGSDDNRLYALDAASGKEQWHFEDEFAVDSSPTVTDGTVYVGNGNEKLYALDADTGDTEWVFEISGGMATTPAVVDGLVYGVSGGHPGKVYAVDAATGTEQWRFTTVIKLYTAPAVVAGTVYVGSDDKHLYALNASDGSEQWSYETGPIWDSSPAVMGKTVYVGSGKTVYAIERTTGETVWTVETETDVASPATVAVDTVYIGTEGGALYALDIADGTVRSRFQVGGALSTTPAVVDGHIYVGSDDHSVYALTGTTKTPARTPPPRSSTTGPFPTPSDPDSRTLPIDELTAGAVLGAAGLGGGGALWLAHRGFGDSDSDGSDHGSAPTSSAPQTHAAESGTHPPATFPSAPDVAIDYDALTDQQRIGTGGTADVTKATVPSPDAAVEVAIKQPRDVGTLHTDTVDQLLDEAEMWASLDDHDFIVDVVDYGNQPVPWIAMEYMDGGPLSRRVGELSLPQSVWTAIAITKGVRHAHRRGVAHLDIKPENILFRQVEDAWDVPKVSDWGFSQDLLDQSGDVEGFSPRYAAPEQFDDELGPVDEITDIYQLGAVFYELFTGRPPFQGEPTHVMRAVLNDTPTPPSDLADVPPAIDEILLTALAKERRDRYESTVVLRNALQNLALE
jgi:outer membrane protein assembly factor BamB